MQFLKKHLWGFITVLYGNLTTSTFFTKFLAPLGSPPGAKNKILFSFSLPFFHFHFHFSVHLSYLQSSVCQTGRIILLSCTTSGMR